MRFPEGGPPASSAEIRALLDRCGMHTYRRAPLVLVRGEGCLVWDAEGRRYLDFVAGIAVNALGHAHPRLVEAICAQAARLMHCSNLYYNEPQARLAEELTRRSGLERAFFCNSGAEANEAALKLARRYAAQRWGPHRYQVVTALSSFHGRTYGALTATGQEKYHHGFEPLVPGFRYVPLNDLEALAAAVDERTCAVLLEPVQGEGGVRPCTVEYLQGAQELCRQRGALLILDEVQTGLGRTGRFWAYEHFGVRPDILTLAKALGGGFPIGAMLAREEVAAAFTPGSHASTFGGNPLACAAALAVLQVMDEEGLPSRAERLGRYLKEKLVELATRLPAVREVRGLGLLVGVELSVPAAPVVETCRERGLLINAIGERVLRLAPPLVVSEAEVDQAVEIIGESLAGLPEEGCE